MSRYYLEEAHGLMNEFAQRMKKTADDIAKMAAEMASGKRCAICTDPIEDRNPVTPLGNHGEAVHDACVDEMEDA